MLISPLWEMPRSSTTPASDKRRPIPSRWTGKVRMEICIMNYSLEGQLKAIACCRVCLSENSLLHNAQHHPDNQNSTQPQTHYPPQLTKDDARSPATPKCMVHNGPRCIFKPCRYRHYYSGCYARHTYTPCAPLTTKGHKIS